MNELSIQSNQSYRSVIVLNNIGVSLLERRCYHQASQTLKDAASLVKALACALPLGFRLQETVHAARQRLAKPQPARHEFVQVDVLPNTGSTEATRAILEVPSCCVHSRGFAIRIDDCDCNMSSQFISSVVLHNFGLSYYCMSKAVKTGSATEKKFLNGAVRLLRVSHSLVAKVITENRETSFQFLHIMVVMLNSLITTLRENKLEEEARPFSSILNRLRSTINEAHCMFCYELAAAAAA